MIGEESLFKDSPLPYNVRTETECDFYVLDIPKLQNVCHDNKHIMAIMQRKVEAKKEMIRRRMKPYAALMESGNTGGMWKHDDAKNTLPTAVKQMQNSDNTNLKIRGFELNKRSRKKKEKMNKKFNFHEDSEDENSKVSTFLPKLDRILNKQKESKKPIMHPPSISNVMSGPNGSVRSQICFKSRETIPDPKHSNYTKGILLKKNLVVSDFTKAMSSKKHKKKKSLLFENSETQNELVIQKRRPMSPNSKRKLKLQEMSETAFGNNHGYGKIIKRLVHMDKITPRISKSNYENTENSQKLIKDHAIKIKT